MDTQFPCPHCGSRFVLDEHSHTKKRETVELNLGSAGLNAPRALHDYFLDTDVYRCPEESCGLSSITFSIRTAFQEPIGARGQQVFRRFIKEWQLVPPQKHQVRGWPESVPKVVRDDFTEACLIVDLSPKAAAALARRCLQGMIRDRYGISMKQLFKEIQALKGKVDEVTWQAIDALREIGNIGAHPEQIPDVIIEIGREDAKQLIQFIERLIEEWYVLRHQKEALPNAIIELAAEIKRLKEAASPPPAG
jgi:hypothetical protein